MFRKLDTHFDNFTETWDSILALVSDKGASAVFPTNNDKALMSTVERYYSEACAIYEDHMNPTPSTTQSMTVPPSATSTGINESRSVRARLPQINLPQFGGNSQEWPLFRDTYKSLIHEEPTLSNMEKFLFLVSCLHGPARSLISNVTLTENNYAQAWKLLTEHYNNKRKLAYSYLKQVMEFKPLTGKPSSSSLKALLTSVVEAIDSFKHLGIPDLGDFLLSYIVLRCLDSATRISFEKKFSEVEFPAYSDVVNFIKSEWKSLDIQDAEPEQPYSHRHKSNYPQASALRSFNPARHSLLSGKEDRHGLAQDRTSRSQQKLDAKHSPPAMSCPVCNMAHNLYQCRQFRKSSPTEKITLLKNWSGCQNCLSSKHHTSQCSSLRRCSICNGGHHSWLHPTQVQDANPSTQQGSGGLSLGSVSGQGEVLLGTAVVQVQDAQGVYHPVRIVTDSGSQFSFMTVDCARKLGLVIKPFEQNISGIGQVSVTSTVGRINCSLRSSIPSFGSKTLATETVVVPMITSQLPQAPLSPEVQRIYKGYLLADPEYCKPGPIEFLLGGDLFMDILTGQPVNVGPNVPRLLPSIFGFIISGPIGSERIFQRGSTFFLQTNDELKSTLEKFWEMEEVPPVDIVSEEDKLCEKLFQETHYRLDSGRYVVTFPVKDTIHYLQNPKGQAFKRLVNLEAKLERNSQLKEEYHRFMREYKELGHMKMVDSNSIAAYMLPHHAVVKTHDNTMKLRTVFDASCRTPNGSLNDHLFTGPKLQLDIRDILTNFRVHQIVFIADIVKMYRQILVHPPDRKYQHILWRFDPKDAVQQFELCTVTYGTSSAPFQAQRTIIQLVRDEGESYPLGSRALLEDIYVDDIATGAATEDEAKNLASELISLLSKGCFELGKWASNSPELLKFVKGSESAHRTMQAVRLSADDEPKIKLLGMHWVPRQDYFSYEITTPSWHPSKRAILSAIARIYDPLGFLSPVVFYAKTILQDLWISKCGWDDVGPRETCLKWHQFLSQLNLISDLKIPRHIVDKNNISTILVGFSDASERGYAAVIYLVESTPSGYKSHLIRARTKLAPIKPMTIPRLELSGALLLSRLYQSCSCLRDKLPIHCTRLFTDSTIVIGWLSTPTQRMNAFVAHRVSQILEMTNKNDWYHVKSEENPADCSSRGLLPSDLKSHPLWWAGPTWLSSPIKIWPRSDLRAGDLPELKRVHLGAVKAEVMNGLEWMERFSSYTRLLRSACYIWRFIGKCRRCLDVPTGRIGLKELKGVTKGCIKLVQNHCKIDANHLKKLRPFIDEDGLLRVGGRLQNSILDYDAKHPIIIPGKSHFAKLLVDYFHRAHLHLGPSALQSVLQSQYWIISARALVRKRVFNCLRCYKANKLPTPPLMGNLPASRLQEGLIFQHVGVDFGGPFIIRESKRRKAATGKAYLSLFVCMSTKAVHLELVSSLETEAFLAALDRFIARRGKPVRLYSDCGTNFVGASRKLKDVRQWYKAQAVQDSIRDHLAVNSIDWSFIPPSAPHFGGIWEAGIKAAKTLMYRIIGETPLTFEELSTLFSRIEAVLNSRPLVPTSADPDCLEALTPGHFLVGRPLTAAPEEDLTSENVGPLKRWSLIKQRSQHFWIRWRNEYLNHLQQRKKWNKQEKNLKEGDLVILKDPNCPQRTWPLARIVAVHPGDDGIVRVVTIKTASGIYKRPVTKIVPLLPINEPIETNEP